MAQDTIPLILEKVMELAGANNLTIKEYQERQELANAQNTEANEWWLPDIYAGLQTHQLAGAAMNADGGFFLEVDRSNLWSGIGLNANWDFADGIFKSKAASLKSDASSYKTEAERNQVILEAIKAYYELQAAQAELSAYQNLVSQADSIASQIDHQVESGLLYESELLLAKSNRNHLKVEMANAHKRFLEKSSRLVNILNFKKGIQLVSADSMMTVLQFEEDLLVESVEGHNRAEIKAIALDLEAIETEKKTTTVGLLIPELAVGAYGSYFGNLSGNVRAMEPNRFPETRQQYPTRALNASLMWNIPLGRLFSGGELKVYNSRISLAEIESEQMKAQIREEITNAQQKIDLGKQQVEIAKESLELTAEAVDQSIKKQENGTAKPFEVFQAQQFYLQALIDYLKSVGDYNAAQYELKVAKGEEL
ncbi:TolC family protein [Marivirga salinae]|uniref:TolC family protein n=1 Tax=Marivirga salinarum TaxID=3059078 RepID=A0AA51NBR3_9BACT|nr:TolC family protein [Marivirga sp. BDSF4-3]WMN12110.1 TolC family protein [Marivirga sp. BDSF4-3]